MRGMLGVDNVTPSGVPGEGDVEDALEVHDVEVHVVQQLGISSTASRRAFQPPLHALTTRSTTNRLPTPSQKGNHTQWSVASAVTMMSSQNELSAMTE